MTLPNDGPSLEALLEAAENLKLPKPEIGAVIGLVDWQRVGNGNLSITLVVDDLTTEAWNWLQYATSKEVVEIVKRYPRHKGRVGAVGYHSNPRHLR